MWENTMEQQKPNLMKGNQDYTRGRRSSDNLILFWLSAKQQLVCLYVRTNH